MTRTEFIKQYPTPQYVIDTWDEMHRGLTSETMAVWERACAKARAEADAAYDQQYGGS